jgi:hypothetical protein
MSQLPDRTKLLLGLLLLIVAIGGWSFLKPMLFAPENPTVVPLEEGVRPPVRRGRRSRSRAKVAELPTEVSELDLELLNPKGKGFEVGRNLWAYYTPPPPPPPVFKPPPPRVVVAPPVTPPPPRATKPQPPPVPYKFVGSFGPKERRIAVLSESRAVINAMEGDVLLKKFRIAKIGYESVTIEYVDFPDAKPAQLEVGG